MSGLVDRATRHLLRRRVVSAFLLCALASWFASMSGTYRSPNPLAALAVLAGGILLALTGARLVQRVAIAAPSQVSGHMLELAARYAPLVVLNLMVVSVLAPALGAVASTLDYLSVLKPALTVLGWLSAQVLCWLFVLGIAGLLVVAVMRLLDRAAARSAPVGRAVSLLDRGVVTATALYCVWAIALTFNGAFDGAPATEHRSDVVRVWGIPHTPLWWADLRSSDAPSDLERVLVFPERDHVLPALLAPGQTVRVRLRPGLFRVAWVESMRLDFERDAERLVAAAPSAGAPRRWLIEILLRDGRWVDVARQTEVYARHHPGDRDFVKRVAAALRDARQSQPAAELDPALLTAARSR